jgi:hypothetical protein
MFLNLLTAKEKLAFLSLAKKLIVSDQVVAQSEEVLFRSMKYEVEILEEATSELNDEEINNMPENIPHICAVFESKKSKISTLMELVALGFVDGKLVPQERELLYEIAHHFGIKREETDSYIEWAARLYLDK